MSLNNLIYLADFEVLDNSNTSIILKYSSETYPGYENRIMVPIFLSQSISFGSSLGGTVSNTIGEIVLQNSDQDLDYLNSYIFAGGTVTVKIYDPTTNIITQLLVQKLEQPIFEWDTISIVLTDLSTQLDNPLQTVKYLGNNVAPDGLEGSADLKDQFKPLLFGLCSNISPKLVNSSKLIYQVAHNQVDLIINVFSNGAYLKHSALTITSLADFQDDLKAPISGEFTVYSGAEGSYIRLNLATGTITLTALEKLNPKLNTPASIVWRILAYFGYTFDSASVIGQELLTQLGIVITTQGGIPLISQAETFGGSSVTEQALVTQLGVNITTQNGVLLVSQAETITADSDFSYIDSKCGEICGLFVDSNSGMTVQAAIDFILSGLGIWSGFDGSNKFRMYYLGDPSLEPVLSIGLDKPLDRFGITAMSVSSPSYNGKVALVKEVNINYDKNYSVQAASSLAGMVADELVNRVEWLGKGFRVAKKSVTGLPINSQVLTYDSSLVGQIAAENEAQRILDLTSVPTNFVVLTVQMPVTDLVKLYPCGVITLYHSRFGWETGVRAIILSYEADFLKESANLTLWV